MYNSKDILRLSTVILLLYSCNKDQTQEPVDQHKDSTCHVSTQEGFAVNFQDASFVPFGAGFKKLYSIDGKVRKVNCASYFWFQAIDSLFYDITYDGNIAHISETHRHYVRDNQTQLIVH